MLEVVIQGRAGLSCCHVLFVMLEIFCVFHKIDDFSAYFANI